MLVGPGGAGKGTVAAALTAADPQLWLSRSWTTRPRRAGEGEDAYVFVTRTAFMDRVSTGGFLEWAEFLGNLYGTPDPEPPPGCDVLLEIDVQGAEQVVAKRPDAVVVVLLPPSDAVQRTRLTARGDSPEQVVRRIATGRDEVARARRLAAHEVVNHQVVQAVQDLAGIVVGTRGKEPDGA
ncbi:MAG: guanylate kinase [Acidimicrobiales bacterium]